MISSNQSLGRDVERVQQIPIISTILNVICQTTGMGFAAVARVTQQRWIACSVRDDIQFGLLPGEELQIETTICNEIRDSHQPVVINHVQQDPVFCNHHTPLRYGFQSYISFPIFLKTGDFFGTLCAIDPKPPDLENEKVMGMFRLFADLIAFHLQQIELLEQSDQTVRNLSRQLTHSIDENRQYRHISNHSLQEPLRKLQLFSSMLVDVAKSRDLEKIEELAAKIFTGARKFSMMIKDLAYFSGLAGVSTLVERIDPNELIREVWAELEPQRQGKPAVLDVSPLSTVWGIRPQIEQLFYQLLHNALKFARKDVPLLILISGHQLTSEELGDLGSAQEGARSSYLEIRIADNGIGIEASQLEKIFDMFSRLPNDGVEAGEGFGLSYCRKIVHQHGGLIKAKSEVGQGTTMIVVLPTSEP